MFTRIFEVASPEIQDRLLMTIESDADPNAGGNADDGLSKSDEEKELEQEEEKESAKGKEGEEDKKEEEGEIDYRQRFADTKVDRDRIASERNELRTRLAKIESDLEEVKTKSETGDLSESEVEALTEKLFKRVSSVKDDDPERGKKIYREIGREILTMKKEILTDLRKQESQTRIQATQNDTAKQEALENAAIALEEIGLDSKKNLHLFQQEVDSIMDSNPRWFKVIPASEQYLRIAERVKKKVESSKRANDEHRKEAGGMLDTGSKVTKKTNQREDEEDDKSDSLLGDMNRLRTKRLSEGARMSKLAGAQ